MGAYFSPQIDKYFAAWILPDTWHKSHWADESRFYKFIKALDYYQDPERLNEARLQEKILSAVKQNHTFDPQVAEEIINQRVLDAREILDFLDETRDFPDPETEVWEPQLK